MKCQLELWAGLPVMLSELPDRVWAVPAASLIQAAHAQGLRGFMSVRKQCLARHRVSVADALFVLAAASHCRMAHTDGLRAPPGQPGPVGVPERL